jgi:glycosyltransferase involved in cell wall biosynthesis
MDAPAWGLRRYALTVLDLIPLVCADLYKAKAAGIRFKFARWLELQAIKNATLVLCISAHTARDVNQILGVPWERLIVTPLGVDEKFFSASTARATGDLRAHFGLSGINEKRPLILYVGGIDPRKNVGVMIRAFADTLQHFRGVRGAPMPLLFMAGGIQKDREFPELERLVQSLGLQNDVVMPGYVDDVDLLGLYASARAFFFPSLYEGFGLPPLEAMAAGLPVVSSDTSAMPEVLGDAAVYFPPTDYQAAAKALISVLSDTERAEKLKIEGQERAHMFTWRKTGESTLRAYDRLLAEHPEGSGARNAQKA